MEKFLCKPYVAQYSTAGVIDIHLRRVIAPGIKCVHEYYELRRFERSWQVGNEND
jgi:hypothetical protein